MSHSATHSAMATSRLHALVGAFVLVMALLAGCASPVPSGSSAILSHGASPSAVRKAVVDTARRMIGVPYRNGGSIPEEGFDCSGLVVYSYRHAGMRGIPRTARDLERQAVPVSLDALLPGDLLFFRLGGTKTNHVAIYEGNRRFIHAPSRGKGVERVAFDHVYWGPRISRAGRLLP